VKHWHQEHSLLSIQSSTRWLHQLKDQPDMTKRNIKPSKYIVDNKMRPYIAWQPCTRISDVHICINANHFQFIEMCIQFSKNTFTETSIHWIETRRDLEAGIWQCQQNSSKWFAFYNSKTPQTHFLRRRAFLQCILEAIAFMLVRAIALVTHN